MGTNTTHRAQLAVGTADDLAGALRLAMTADREAGYRQGRWIGSTAGGPGESETRTAYEQAGAAATEKEREAWHALYDYAGAVGDLRDKLRELVSTFGDLDADEELHGLELWESLQTIVLEAFGPEGAEL